MTVLAFVLRKLPVRSNRKLCVIPSVPYSLTHAVVSVYVDRHPHMQQTIVRNRTVKDMYRFLHEIDFYRVARAKMF